MIIREKVRIGDQVVTLETGRIAKQAGGSCLVRAGDTIVLVTACGNQEPKPGQGFFPLSVDYQEKTYAAGKIPGGFFKREGKLRDYEVLTSRLIDRPCRPLFPEGYLAEVQIVATVMSFDGVNPPDTLAMIGASAALHISQIPWNGPIAGVRVGRVDGQFIANPSFEQMAESDCELLVAASRDAIVMVEGEAEEMSEEDMVEALFFAHRAVQDTLDLIERMRQAVGKPKWVFAGDTTPQILRDRVQYVAGYKAREACNIANKGERAHAFKQLKREAVELLAPEFPGQEETIKAAFEDLRYSTMRLQVLDEGRRLDGRDTRTVRPISIELGVLPRVHGSSLFTRGETQAIVTSTFGTSRDAQRLDTLQGDVHKRFLLHYNFPPYSVGECKPMRGPGRREVGHGDLAERALAKVLPTQEQFPYTIRIVSEITESNGSSSMASVCGGALALMDAGVPIRAPVAGVAMGLIKEGERYAVLTDILGDEDALGDMDFKVCGTDKGVTAIQMDIKIEGLSREILETALSQAREARLHILDKMTRAIPAPRDEMSRYAPRITQIRVKPDQVRTIIGPGGKMIRAIVDQTGAAIDVEDDGTVNVSSADSASVAKALEIIKSLTTEPEVGEIYEGTVKRIEPYGAFLEILPGKDGLCHISDVDWTHVANVEDYFKLGDKVQVKLTNIDREGRIRLSRKDAIPEPIGAAKLNGRAPAGEFEERKPRDLDRKPRRDFERKPREVEGEELAARDERPARDFDRKPRDLDRKPREERAPRFEAERDLELEPRLERVVAKSDLSEERPARDFERKPARDFERKPARDFERKPVRDFDEERPARDLERPRSARSFDERPAREERPVRDELGVREERPVRDELGVREERSFERKPARDLEREERPLRARGRDLERDERPAARPRDLDRDARPARAVEREERKPRDLDSDRRPARSREFERPLIADERDDRPRRDEAFVRPRRDVHDDKVESAEPVRRSFERRPRTEERIREERAPRSEERIARDDRGARAEERDFDEPRLARAPRRELDDRPARSREPELEAPRGRREPRDFDRAPARTRDVEARPARELDREVRPARELDREVRPARELDREVRPARELDREVRPARELGREVRPARDELEAPRGRREPDAMERSARPRMRGLDEPAHARDELRARREPDLSERRARREEPAAVEERRVRGDDERASERPRARSAEAPREAGRPAFKRREEPVEEPAFQDRAVPGPRDRDERIERDRPSRVRARARNRERVRELERERERD